MVLRRFRELSSSGPLVIMRAAPTEATDLGFGVIIRPCSPSLEAVVPVMLLMWVLDLMLWYGLLAGAREGSF